MEGNSWYTKNSSFAPPSGLDILGGIGNSCDVVSKFGAWIEERVQGLETPSEDHGEVSPETFKVGHGGGFLLDFMEHIPDAAVRGLMLQEVGQHAVADKCLGCREDLGGKIRAPLLWSFCCDLVHLNYHKEGALSIQSCRVSTTLLQLHP